MGLSSLFSLNRKPKNRKTDSERATAKESERGCMLRKVEHMRDDDVHADVASLSLHDDTNRRLTQGGSQQI